MTSSVFSHEEALPCRRIGGGRDPLPGVGRAAGLAAVAILSLAWAGPAAADERLIRDYLVDEVRQWSSSSVVMMTLEASNARFPEIGRPSWRERAWQYVVTPVGAVLLKN